MPHKTNECAHEKLLVGFIIDFSHVYCAVRGQTCVEYEPCLIVCVRIHHLCNSKRWLLIISCPGPPIYQDRPCPWDQPEEIYEQRSVETTKTIFCCVCCW